MYTNLSKTLPPQELFIKLFAKETCLRPKKLKEIGVNPYNNTVVSMQYEFKLYSLSCDM